MNREDLFMFIQGATIFSMHLKDRQEEVHAYYWIGRIEDDSFCIAEQLDAIYRGLA